MSGREAGAWVAVLILAPAAITFLVALLRGYKIDIHFEPQGGGWLHRKRKSDSDDDKEDDDDSGRPAG